jgi:hypothetical protein
MAPGNASIAEQPRMSLRRRQGARTLGLAHGTLVVAGHPRGFRARRAHRPSRCSVPLRSASSSASSSTSAAPGSPRRVPQAPERDQRDDAVGRAAELARRDGVGTLAGERPAASVQVDERLPAFHVAGEAVEVVGARERDAVVEIALGGGERVQLARRRAEHDMRVGDRGAARRRASAPARGSSRGCAHRARSRRTSSPRRASAARAPCVATSPAASASVSARAPQAIASS